MPDEQTPSLMDKMLGELKERKAQACIHLKNGVAMRGLVLEFDATSIKMTKGKNSTVVIERNAVSSAMVGEDDFDNRQPRGGAPLQRR